MRQFSQVLICTAAGLCSIQALGQAVNTGKVEVMSLSSTPVNDLIYEAKTQSLPPLPVPNGPRGLKINLIMNCFGTNNRVVQYPLSPSSEIQFEIKILSQWVAVAFPAIYVSPNPSPGGMLARFAAGANDLIQTNPANIASASLSPHNVQIITQNINVSSQVLADGTIPVGARMAAIQKLSFRQNVVSTQFASNQFDWEKQSTPAGKHVYEKLLAVFSTNSLKLVDLFSSQRAYAGGGDGSLDPGLPALMLSNAPTIGDGGYGTTPPAAPLVNAASGFMGQDSNLTSSFTTSWSGDMSQLQINASFPGQDGFCGGFRSPLMFFFDQARPHFSNAVSFRLNESQHHTNWVERSAPGYFLALDRNHDGIINDGGELFGDVNGSTNGFTDLALFDLNHDHVIDSRDPIFKELLLWQDKNGDGISQPDELFTMKAMGIRSISLEFQEGKDPVGVRAELRERAPFVYKKASGGLGSGQVVDVWFPGEL